METTAGDQSVDSMKSYLDRGARLWLVDKYAGKSGSAHFHGYPRDSVAVSSVAMDSAGVNFGVENYLATIDPVFASLGVG